jgi:hypothetical protein
MAIRVDNWNEQQNIQQEIQAYSKLLIADLKKDIEEAEIRKSQIDWKIEVFDSVLPFFRHKTIEEIDNADIFLSLGYYINYRPLTWHRNTIEELKSSGSVHYIENDSLKRMISQYYSFLDHLGEDYIDDTDLAKSIADNIRHFANLNYPKPLKDSIATLWQNVPFKEWFSSPLYKQVLDYRYNLLTDEIKDLQYILNQLQSMRQYFGYRQVEYPTVVQNAKEIIGLLEESYPEN